MTTLLLDRPHRFHQGAMIRHRDALPGNAAEIVALTLRVVDGVAYPTYLLMDALGEEFPDVLCTVELVSEP